MSAPWAERVRHGVGCTVAVLAVIGASYAWRLPRSHSPRAVFVVYLTSFVLLALGALALFRWVVRLAYRRHRRLTPLSLFVQCLIWGLFFAFPCIYNPPNWAWSQSSSSRAVPVLGAVGWVCVGGGLIMLAVAFARLGIRRSCGQVCDRLEVSGLYRVSRNPQLLGGIVLVVGYVVLWPSLYALGWVILFAVLAHAMVLAEESYLRAVHGDAYVRYCRRAPRYLGLPRGERRILPESGKERDTMPNGIPKPVVRRHFRLQIGVRPSS